MHTLDPIFDPNATIRQHATEMMRELVMKSLSAGNLFNTLLEAKGFLDKLPARINNLLDAIANNELKLRVEAIAEKKLMEGFQKIANGITMGPVIAVLIIGAAMLMRVETSCKIFGYPGLAMIFFFIAAGAPDCGSSFTCSSKAKRRRRSSQFQRFNAGAGYFEEVTPICIQSVTCNRDDGRITLSAAQSHDHLQVSHR